MFGMRKWSTPVLRPAAPFIAGGLAVFYLVAKAQDAMINSKYQISNSF
jgi:F-type H+-transporting ATPase subunit j